MQIIMEIFHNNIFVHLLKKFFINPTPHIRMQIILFNTEGGMN